MPFPSPAPTPAPPPGRFRRWPWALAVAGVILSVLAAGTAVVLTRDDEASAVASTDLVARAEALLRDAAPATVDDDRGDVNAGGDGGDGPGSVPAEPEPSDDASDPLEDLLGGLDGAGSGAADVDPACLLGDGDSPPRLSGSIDGTVEEQIAEIARRVEQERGLRFEVPVEPELLSADEFDRRIADMVRAEYPVEQADLDSRLLQLLGAIPRGTDLKALQEDLMAGQVAGYYDPDTGQVVVRVPEGSDSLDANGQITLAHELDHALTDQVLGLPDIAEPNASDANLARLGLVEGDATLLMQRFALQSVGLLDQLGAATGPDALAAQEDLAAIPPYLRNELMFPYTAGLSYACRLHQDGGWEGVDAAYRDLPLTTAEILFAERRGFEPADPADVGAPGGSWDEAYHDTLGAAPLQWLLEAPGGDEDRAVPNAADAVRAWGGGELTLFVDGPRSALGLALVDDGTDGGLCDAVEAWYAAAFDTSRTTAGSAVVLQGDDQVGVLRCEGSDVRLGIAPDVATATSLAS